MPLLLIVSILSPLIPLIAGIRKRFTLLWLYVMAGFSFDLMVTIQKRVFHLNQNPASNLFVLVEFLLISVIYQDKIARKPTLFYFFVFGLGSFFIANTLNKTIYDFNAFGASFFMFGYILFAISGFHSILQDQKILFLEKSSFFWTNVAFMVYASGNLLLFLFRDYLLAVDKELFIALWRSMFLMLNISKNILLTMALYRYKPALRGSR